MTKTKADIIGCMQKQIKQLQESIYKIQITGEIPTLTHNIKIRKSFKNFLKENPEYKDLLENKHPKSKDLSYQLLRLSKIVKSDKLSKSTAPLNIANSRYIRIAMYLNVEQLLRDIVNTEEEYYTLPNGYKVKPSSLRYQTFNKSLICSNCGIKGCFLALERCISDLGGNEGNKEGQGYHLNLYALDNNGNEVLMTKDHIIPKSKGGKDIVSNMQTMCSHCNENKGNKLSIDPSSILLNNIISKSLSTRVRNTLNRNYPSIAIENFINLTDMDFYRLRNIGKQSLLELITLRDSIRTNLNLNPIDQSNRTSIIEKK